MTKARKIFNALKGSWKFFRVLSGNGTVSGDVRFKLLKKRRLHYYESGVWTQSEGAAAKVYRHYIYELSADEACIEVFHAESSEKQALFITYGFFGQEGDTIQSEAIHQCANDLYNAHFSFFGHNTFQLRYDVKGPNKDYSSSTTYIRVDDTPGKL